MGCDLSTSRTSAKPFRPLVTAVRSIHRGAALRFLVPCMQNPAFPSIPMGRSIVSYRRAFMLILLLFVLGVTQRTPSVSASDEWQPISQEELKMTSVPEAPGAPAIILYRQVDRDDRASRTPHEFDYVREKIFTEAGRKYADVEIPFVKNVENIHSIKARTIRPDGTIVNFDGKIYEKEIVKARGFKYLAKTFTLSDVQPGSIIEYHYTIDFAEYLVFDSNWVLSDELFSKKSKFTLKPYGQWV